MAKPAKRRIDPEGQAATDAGRTSSGADASGRQPVTSRRVTPAKGAAAGPSRSARAHRPSPTWVPVLMFALWGLGLLVIILNYMQILPGATDGGNGWYLVGGLGSILAGIIVATQYR